MGQNHSKYFNELRRSQRLKESCMKIVTTPQVLTVKSVEKHSRCVSIAFEEEGAGAERYATKAALEEQFIKGIVVFSVPSLKLAWYYGDQCSAKAAQIDAGLEGRCRNVLLAEAMLRQGCRDKYRLRIPCFICKKYSNMVRWKTGG